jgi:hypothetical protein
MSANSTLNFDQLIKQTMDAAEQLQRLVSEDRSYVIKKDRDHLCLIYWTLCFEHHYSILLLSRNGMNASAFALLRPFEEAFFRMFIVMHGTQNQFESIRNGTYTTDFNDASARLSKHLGQGATIQDLYKVRIKRLHGFTHGGHEQVSRFVDGKDIVSNFAERDIREMIEGTMFHVHVAAQLVTDFLGLTNENVKATEAFDKFAKEVVAAAHANSPELDASPADASL